MGRPGRSGRMARKATKRVAKARKTTARAVTPRKAATGAATKTPTSLYYCPTPNGFKVSIMLEECRQPKTKVPVNISKGEQFNPDFLRISPNNRMPAIVDPQNPSNRPNTNNETGAILQY